MRWIFGAWACVGLVGGCGAHGPEATRVAAQVGEPVAEPVRQQVPAPEGEPPRRSCKASAPARELGLQLGDRRVEAGGRSFVHAWRREGERTEVVIVGVDALGEPLVVPLPLTPGEPLAIGADAGGLVIVSVPHRGTGALVRVELVEDGSLLVGPKLALPQIEWGWPGTIASDGTRALVQHTLATPQQTAGEEVLYTVDLKAGRVVGSVKTGASTQCAAGVCTTLSAGEGTARFWRRTPAGEELEVSVPLTSGCPAVYPVGDALWVLPGAPWRALALVERQLRAVAVADSLVAIAGCGSLLAEFPSRRWPGLVSEGSLLRWDGRSFGAEEELPRGAYERVERFEHADGVIEIGWQGGSGMMHSPTDAQGRRRYFNHWYFEGGEVRLLRREAAGFVASEAVALAVAGAEGTMHEGYAPTLLRSGPHAVVLIAAQGGGEGSWWQPYLAPCGAR